MVLYEKAPAKVNLSLDVLGKRGDGYHEVEMVMTTVDLFDRIELEPLAEDVIVISLETRFVPNDERNLAYKAARLMKDLYKVTSGVRIKIDKSIPVSAGLGGGSTNAAAVLRGLNRLWSLGLTLDELARIGASIGSDVSFCVYGGTAIGRGRGEQLEHINAPPPCWVVLAKLDIGVSSKTIFGKLNLDELDHPDVGEMVEAIEEQDFTKMCGALGNVLEQVTLKLHPTVAKLKEKMDGLGAKGILMSGSGPTIYGLVEQETKARKIYNGLRGFCDDVHVVRMLG